MLAGVTNLRMDPFERAAHEGMDYNRWTFARSLLVAPAAAYVGQGLQSFRIMKPDPFYSSSRTRRPQSSTSTASGS